MEPLTSAAIATLIATKAFEKTGEKVSESVWNLISRFLSALKQKDPETATAIEQVAMQPGLAEQQPEIYGSSVLTSKVEAVTQEDLALQQAAQAVAEAIKAQPTTLQNITKLAEKIGINIQGGYNPISGNTFNI